MPNLNFMQAVHLFGTKKDAISYFILVENYEKYLNGEQKKNF